jgi:microcystin-dependent protein
MADVTTQDLKIVLQETGGNSNTWGSVLNDTLSIIEDAIVDAAAVSVTVANVTLSDTENRKAVLKFSGVLTANRDVIVRDALKEWDCYNGCTGGFTLTIKTSAGTGFVLPSSKWARARCDAVNVERCAYEATVYEVGSIPTAAIADGAVTSAKLESSLTGQAVPTGARIGFTGITLPTGWVWGNGTTIGDGTSGGTGRANADTEALFTLLWEGYAQTELPIQTSAGGASSRGANAATDFAAHKRMPVPDYKERVAAGLGTMGGTASTNRLVDSASNNSLNGDTIGDTGGVETATLTSAQSALQSHTHTGPAHTHLLLANASGNSGSNYPTNSEQIAKDNSTGGSGSYDMFGTATAATLALSSSSGTGNTGSASASATAHGNVQPTIIENVIIKL